MCRVRPRRHKKQGCYPIWHSSLLRAGDGTRTRDILLGRQTLYQLSYARKNKGRFGRDILARPHRAVKLRHSFITWIASSGLGRRSQRHYKNLPSLSGNQSVPAGPQSSSGLLSAMNSFRRGSELDSGSRSITDPGCKFIGRFALMKSSAIILVTWLMGWGASAVRSKQNSRYVSP